MPGDAPTILATSGGFREGRRTRWEFSELTEYAIELAGVTGHAPRLCFVATALGDNPTVLHWLIDAARARGLAASHLTLFPMPNVDDITAHLLDHDVVWVFGGSVAGLLAMWRLHGVDAAMRTAWQARVVLTGISAGSAARHRRARAGALLERCALRLRTAAPSSVSASDRRRHLARRLCH
jgi:peptidase E